MSTYFGGHLMPKLTQLQKVRGKSRLLYDQGPMEFRKKFKTHKLAEDANDARG
ncbi:hypothetical protein NXC14_PA00137 (plasmid) [Rhizobium sp. NXC14]|nr:hypothetical protein NXC14_PA00137 [Rhizobium sp. NXC14]